MEELPNNLYSNICLLAPDGEVLSKVPAKRARWYLRKGLAHLIDENTLQLDFEPAGRRKLSDWYLIEHKNRCVICGETDHLFLEKHHIVPVCFRTHLPDRLKDKRCFDLTLLCQDCHDDYEHHALDFKDQLIAEAGLHKYELSTECKQKRAAIKAMKSLLSNFDRINEIGKARCEARIVVELGRKEFVVNDIDKLSEEICEAQERVFSQTILHHQPYEQFIVRWRKHFIECAKPKFIDPSWIKDLEVVE